MDWKAAVTTFALVFVAELGDKTQLATMMLSARTGAIWPVFLGAGSALVLSALIGVLAGALVSRFIPPHYLQGISGAFFVVIGLLLLLRKI